MQDKKILEGTRSNGTKREFYQSDSLPPVDCCSAVFWIPIDWEMVPLTKNRKGRELPWWHVEDGETLEEALGREISEETGRTMLSHKLFGYKKIYNQEPKEKPGGWMYPFPHGYIPHYFCTLHPDITHDLASEIEESQTFLIEEVYTMWLSVHGLIELANEVYKKL